MDGPNPLCHTHASYAPQQAQTCDTVGIQESAHREFAVTRSCASGLDGTWAAPFCTLNTKLQQLCENPWLRWWIISRKGANSTIQKNFRRCLYRSYPALDWSSKPWIETKVRASI